MFVLISWTYFIRSLIVVWSIDSPIQVVYDQFTKSAVINSILTGCVYFYGGLLVAVCAVLYETLLLVNRIDNG